MHTFLARTLSFKGKSSEVYFKYFKKDLKLFKQPSEEKSWSQNPREGSPRISVELGEFGISGTLEVEVRSGNMRTTYFAKKETISSNAYSVLFT